MPKAIRLIKSLNKKILHRILLENILLLIMVFDNHMIISNISNALYVVSSSNFANCNDNGNSNNNDASNANIGVRPISPNTNE